MFIKPFADLVPFEDIRGFFPADIIFPLVCFKHKRDKVYLRLLHFNSFIFGLPTHVLTISRKLHEGDIGDMKNVRTFAVVT